MNRNNVIQNEIKRKAFHFLSLVYALGYFFLERHLILMILSAILVIESVVEFGRFFAPKLNMKIVGFFGGIHRQEELLKPTGIFWTLLGSLVTMGLFQDRNVVLCAMGYLIFSDAAAALIGVRYGRHKFGKISLEGSAACFFVSVVVGLFFLELPMALLAAVFVTIVEAVPLPYNDNLWIPLLSAVFLTAIG